MKTKQIPQPIKYEIIEKDKSGLIPDWAERVIYSPYRSEGQICFMPSSELYDEERAYALSGDTREERAKRIDEQVDKRTPELTPEEVQEIVGHLETSLIHSD